MKFIHISDLHIGLKLLHHDLLEEQKDALRQVVDYAAAIRPDAVVIAGDVYDKAVPPAEAVEVFDGFITALSEAVPEMAIMAVAGNHDSAPRLECFSNLLSRQKIHIVGLPPMHEGEEIEKVRLRDEFGEVCFYLLPFVSPRMVREIIGPKDDGSAKSYAEAVGEIIGREEIDQGIRNVIVSHQFYLPSGVSAAEVPRAESEVVTVGNIDQVPAEVLKSFEYAALGHIHRAMKVGEERFRYSGTLQACSVSEAGQKKSALCVALGEKGTAPVIEQLPIKPLHEVRVIKGTLEDILKQEGSEDYVSVVIESKGSEAAFDSVLKIRNAFPNLLEVKRSSKEIEEFSYSEAEGATDKNPIDMCAAFIPSLDEEDLRILEEVINEAQETGEI